MAISHICRCCGRELCNEVAARDTGLDLPIVVCPACHTPAIRYPPTSLRVSRTPIRLLSSTIRVFIWIALLIPAVALFVYVPLLRDLDRVRESLIITGAVDAWDELTDDAGGRAAAFFFAAIIPGLILGSAFGLLTSHWRRRSRVLALLAVPVLLAAIVELITALLSFGRASQSIAWRIAPRFVRDLHSGIVELRTPFFEFRWFQILEILAVQMLGALLGLAIGSALHGLRTTIRTRLYRVQFARRRRLRKALA